jgi:hypothetical protein
MKHSDVALHNRYFKGGDLGPLDEKGVPVNGYPLAAPPSLGPSAPVASAALDLGLLALAHGMPAQFAPDAVARGTLRSSARRLGPTGRYSRDADVRGGGAAAVYTRAVVAPMRKWNAGGHGVGSGEGRAQLIIAPRGLFEDNDHWHCASLDNMGFAPGAKAARVAVGDINAAWKCQTRAQRLRALNDLMKTGSMAHNNELMHWDELSLEGRLLGIFIAGTKPAYLDHFKAHPNFSPTIPDGLYAPAVQASPPRGCFRVGSTDQLVPVYSIPKSDINISGWIREASRKWREAHI